MLKKLMFIALSSFISVVSINAYAFGLPTSVEGSWQEHEGEKVDMKMEGTNNSTQAINDKKTKENGLSVQKIKVDKEMKMEMKDSKNSVQCGNNYSSSSSISGVYQGSQVKDLKMAQTGGRSNTQAVNCIQHK
jgi:hypothetical protein